MKRKKLDYPLILLCAGKSERMDVPKGLLKVNRVPLFLEHIRQFKEAGGRHAVVVLGYHAEKYYQQISWTSDIHEEQWIEHEGINIAVIINQQPHQGQFSSLLCGLERLNKEYFQGAFVMPVDLLPPEKDTWREIENNMTGTIKVCIPSWKGKGGHPVLLGGIFIQEIIKIPKKHPDARLDHQIKRLPKELVKLVETPDKNILGNANTPDEFNALSRLNGRNCS
jgi:CTP:molybdopterin cytidylyltransferase MocA